MGFPPPGSLFSLCAVDNSAYFVMCQVWLHEHRGSLSPFKHALILAKVFHFYLISCMKMLIILLANIDAENIKKLTDVHVANKVLQEYLKRKLFKANQRTMIILSIIDYPRYTKLLKVQ